jgi:large subunit ribosomal protein L15
MNLSDVHQGVHKRKLKKRVGRGIGSGHGKTAGRGNKGQYASAGANLPGPLYEGGQMMLARRVPMRGFSNARFRRTYNIVNVGDLEQHFHDGDTVNAETLKARGLAKAPADGLRILGNGVLTRKLTVVAHGFSQSAREKIQNVGGTVEVIPPPKKPVRNKMGTRKKLLAEKFKKKS